MITTLPRIKDLPPDHAGVAFFLCCGKEVRQGKAGEFITVTLQDSTGQLLGRVFDNVDQLRHEFEAGEFVKVQGRSQIHNGRLQLVIENIRRVISSDVAAGFREEDCVCSAPRPLDEMWEELEALVLSVSDPFVRTLLDRVVHSEEARLRIWPAAVTVHHAYRGGFLEHVLKVAGTVRFLAGAYGADLDLVVAGALLHDIGKLHELEHDVATRYSRDGNLIGHITLGVMAVHEACAAIPGFPDDLRSHIEHLIVSHHGTQEFGSPVEPMTVEAFILSMADDLDAKIHQVRHAAASDLTETEFTGYQSRLGRVLWKGARAGAPVSPTG
jgi:3'-5' exoribonuclease